MNLIVVIGIPLFISTLVYNAWIYKKYIGIYWNDIFVFDISTNKWVINDSKLANYVLLVKKFMTLPRLKIIFIGILSTFLHLIINKKLKNIDKPKDIADSFRILNLSDEEFYKENEICLVKFDKWFSILYSIIHWGKGVSFILFFKK